MHLNFHGRSTEIHKSSLTLMLLSIYHVPWQEFYQEVQGYYYTTEKLCNLDYITTLNYRKIFRWDKYTFSRTKKEHLDWLIDCAPALQVKFNHHSIQNSNWVILERVFWMKYNTEIYDLIWIVYIVYIDTYAQKDLFSSQFQVIR